MGKLTKQDGMNASIIGKVAELQVAQRLMLIGYEVALPLNDIGYDLVIFIKGEWKTVQVKTAGLYSPSKGYKYSRLDLTSGRHTYQEYCKRFNMLAVVQDKKIWLIPSLVIKGRYISLTKKYDMFLI